MRPARLAIVALVFAGACSHAPEESPGSSENSGGPPPQAAMARPGVSAGEPGSPPPPAATVLLKEGDAAPAFSSQGDDGQPYSLAALKGKQIVLYFYPKDDTLGCTIEAKAFRDDSDKFKAKNAVVLGVSMDDVTSHKAFREKYQLNFPLLVGGEEIAKAYGVPVNGGYASRETFVIGADGRIVKVFPRVNPNGHSAEILAVLK